MPLPYWWGPDTFIPLRKQGLKKALSDRQHRQSDCFILRPAWLNPLLRRQLQLQLQWKERWLPKRTLHPLSFGMPRLLIMAFSWLIAHPPYR